MKITRKQLLVLTIALVLPVIPVVIVCMAVAVSSAPTLRTDDVKVWFSAIKPGDPIEAAVSVMKQKSIVPFDHPVALPDYPTRVVSGRADDNNGVHFVGITIEVDRFARIIAIHFTEGDQRF